MPEGIGESSGADEVARLLQELKSRSGLSYGALAKRLHVSTSALHRYCNGDVMPVEFAPLEGFARLCRATAEEHTELYRWWVAAQAARGNRQASGREPVAAATAAAPEPLRGSEPGVGLITGPEARPAAGGVAEDGTADPVRTSAVLTWRRVRQGVLAVAATVAVFAAIGAVTTGVKPRPGGDPTSVPAPAGAADRRESTPIAVTVRWPGRADGCEQYLVDRPPSQVPRPPAPADVAAWVSQVGAVPGHYGSVELAVQGTGSETVVLTALNVRVVRTGAPLTWNAYAMGEGCGGGVDLHSYDLDLDAARPRLVVSGGSTGLPLKVSERDPEVIEVSAETISHDVDWYLELEWSSGDRKGTLTVGPGTGAPFRTSAVRNRPLYRVPNGGNAWEPAPVQE